MLDPLLEEVDAEEDVDEESGDVDVEDVDEEEDVEDDEPERLSVA